MATPFIYGFAWPSALGNCLPVLGEVGLPIPPQMFAQSVWAVITRPNNIKLSIIAAPAVGAVSGVSVAVTGLPEPAAAYALWWWFSEDVSLAHAPAKNKRAP